MTKPRTAAGVAALLGLWAVFSGTVHAEDAASVGSHFAPGAAISSDEDARQALEAVQTERAIVHARFEREQATCYDRFLVNQCIEEAKERRRSALEPLDEIELNAKRFQRQQRAQVRERDMIERRKRADEKAAQAAAVVPPPPRTVRPPPPAPNNPPRALKPREAVTPEQEQAEARERAENEVAYTRKVQAARERQEALARRKAEKEQGKGRASGAEE